MNVPIKDRDRTNDRAVTSPINNKVQEMFNRVKKHLLTQNQKSMLNDSDCAYKSDDGLRCAIGVLIPEADYEPIMEMHGPVRVNRPVMTVLITEFQLSGFRQEEQDYFMNAASDLQSIHDTTMPEGWPILLANFAAAYKIIDTPMEQL